LFHHTQTHTHTRLLIFLFQCIFSHHHHHQSSLNCLFLGAAISYRTPAVQNDFSLIIFILNVFTIITVHCAGNVVNTYFDYVKGIDNRKSDDRTLVDHLLTKDEVSVWQFYAN
jgi:1,4-dihydroxy-2-naphthoate octaprenyltransferase